MGSTDLLVMMLALPMVGLAGCLRWYVARAAGELEDFRAVVPGVFLEALDQQAPADALTAPR